MQELLTEQTFTYLVQLLTQHWPQILFSLALFLLTYFLTTHRRTASPISPSTVFVPSTSTYPSAAYTEPYKLHITQLLSDLHNNHIELRGAQSGQALLRITDVASFTPSPALLLQGLQTITRHSAAADKQNIENYVLSSDALLEEIQGPDRLPLVGCFRDCAPAQLEQALDAQLARIGSDYLDLSSDDRLLDIGMHWGDVSVYLAHEHNVPTCAVLPAASQLAHAANLAGESKAHHLVRLTHGDYRAIPSAVPDPSLLFTKAMVLDSLDFVGSRNLPVFFENLSNALDLNARLLLQVTTTPSSLGPPNRCRGQLVLQPASADSGDSLANAAQGHPNEDEGEGEEEEMVGEDEEVATLRLGAVEEHAELWWYHAFRLQHICPGADTPAFVSIERVLAELQRAGFEVMQVESLTTDQALTAATWCRRLCLSKRQIEVEMGPDTYKAWELYLNWTQSLFARGRLHKHFVLAVKRM